MYIQPEYLTSRNGLQCPECHKISPTRRIKIFKTKRALARHLVNHDIPYDSRRQISILAKEFDQGSFIQLCVDRGILY